MVKRIATFAATLAFAIGLLAFIGAASGTHWGTLPYGYLMFVGVAIGVIAGLLLASEIKVSP